MNFQEDVFIIQEINGNFVAITLMKQQKESVSINLSIVNKKQDILKPLKKTYLET